MPALPARHGVAGTEQVHERSGEPRRSGSACARHCAAWGEGRDRGRPNRSRKVKNATQLRDGTRGGKATPPSPNLKPQARTGFEPAIFGLRDRRLTTWPPRLRWNGGSASLYPGVAPVSSPRGHELERERARPAVARPRPVPAAGGAGRGSSGRAPDAPRGLPPTDRPALGGSRVRWGGGPGVPTATAKEACPELGSRRNACRRRSQGSNPSSARLSPRPSTARVGASVSPLGRSTPEAEERWPFWLPARPPGGPRLPCAEPTLGKGCGMNA